MIVFLYLVLLYDGYKVGEDVDNKDDEYAGNKDGEDDRDENENDFDDSHSEPSGLGSMSGNNNAHDKNWVVSWQC